jgi:hypothetical protein
MRSRNHSSFDDVAETALEEQSKIFSKTESYKSSNTNSEGPKCSNGNKLGHVASRCYLKDKKCTKFNQVSLGIKTERKTAILLVMIAKEKSTWRSAVGNPRSV